MATILSSNLLQFFMPIILFIFIFSIFFALLTKIKFFGESKPLNSLIAFCVTILFLVIPEARQVIETATPWFVVFVVFGLLMVLAFMVLGVDAAWLKGMAEENAVILGLIIGVIVLIFLVSFTQTFGASIVLPPGAQDTSIIAIGKRTVLNPKILGFLILFIIAGEVVRRVGFPASPTSK